MTVSLDFTELVTKLNKAVEYSIGFATAIQQERQNFNHKLGTIVVDLLGQYIDSQARLSPERLHHVYEWGQAGNSSARLFNFTMVATATDIKISGTFLESGSTPPSGGEPFRDKASIMENGMSLTITPKEGGVIAFDVDGETVFSSSEIFVAHPGGPDVAGAFAETVDNFIHGYVTAEVIAPIFRRMSTPKEFKRYFPAGVKSGYRTGQMAGREYMHIGGFNEVD